MSDVKCDGCGADITHAPGFANGWRLVLSQEELEPKPDTWVADMMLEPPIDRARFYRFCSCTCLGKWATDRALKRNEGGIAWRAARPSL